MRGFRTQKRNQGSNTQILEIKCNEKETIRPKYLQ